MRTTAVLDRDHPAVGTGELIGTDTEGGPQRAGQPDEEAAGPALGRGVLGHLAVRTEVAVLPALGRIQASIPGQHPDPAEAEFETDLLDLRITGVEVARHQPGIIRRGRQQITRAQITRLQPLAPRHPLRGQQRTLAGQQHDLGHARLGLRGADQRHRPVPAEVTRQGTRETVGGGVFGLGPHAQVGADLRAGLAGLADPDVRAGQIDGGSSGQIDGGGENRVDDELIYGRGHDAIVPSGASRYPTRLLRAAGWTA